jgi:hypothetical protein
MSLSYRNTASLNIECPGISHSTGLLLNGKLLRCDLIVPVRRPHLDQVNSPPMMARRDEEDDGSYSRGITKDESLYEKLQPTKGVAIGPTDVLCGRGKISFNHGKD